MQATLLQHELEDAALQYGDNIALISPNLQLSYNQVNKRATALAASLQQLGLSPGDRLAILGHNSIDYICWHYGAAKAGVIFHVLNTRLALGELSWMIDNAQSSALIVDPHFVDLARQLQQCCPSLNTLIGMSGELGLDYNSEQLAQNQQALTAPTIEPTAAALMIYTSGTTGRPKGALQSHAGSVLADQLTRDAVAISDKDRYLALMPFFHQAGLIRSRATLLAGGSCIILGKVDAAAAADAIVEHHITFTMLASAQHSSAIRDKLAATGPASFTALRMILGGGGGGHRAVDSMGYLCKALGCDYFGVYGQTESTGPAVFITGSDVFQRPTSCGRAFPGIDVAIWDGDGQPLSQGQQGQIVIRGGITARYWRNETANSALYCGQWILTGDIGCLDEEGFLYFKGRIKELIKTGAENVYPREVEAVLEQHPAVADVAVFGLPDSQWGERVCVAVVSRGHDAVTLAQLRDYCRDKIGGYKIPKQLLLTDTIPRNHTGKILRHALIERALKQS